MLTYRADFWKTPEGTAGLTAMSVGMLTHLYGLVTELHNYDSITVQPAGYGTGVTSGRWFLSLTGDLVNKLGGNYNVFAVNGIVFILLLAVSACFLVNVFGLRSRLSAALMGALMVVFPSVTSTMFFRYTAGYYGLAILLAVLAVWVLPRYKFGLLLSALCTACSLGIYQAYVPLTIGIFVLLLIRQAVWKETDLWGVVRRGLYDCLALGLGLVLYFLLMNLTLKLYGTALSDYQGVGEMGKLALGDVPGLVWQAFSSFLLMPVRDYCGLAHTKLLKLLYLALAGITFVGMAYLLLVKNRKPLMAAAACVLCLLFPVAVNFVVIMCPDSWIYTLMVYGFVLVPSVPLVLLDGEAFNEEALSGWKALLKKAAALTVAVITVCYAYGANVNYTALYYSNRQVENYLNSIVVQVRMTEGFDTEKEWAFLGEIDDPLLFNYWMEEPLYGGSNPAHKLMNKYSRNWWIQNLYGYSIPSADSAECESLAAREEVKAMPCWPDAGSIKVVEDFVVIKFQELAP